MGTTAEKARRTLDSKNAVKNSIINKGGNITDTTPFSQYATAIDNLPSGASNGEPLVVEELPTENINEKAIYQTNKKFTDLYIVQDREPTPLSEIANVKVIGAEEVETKPTDNIVQSNLANYEFYLYYVKSENDIFAYGNAGYGLMWISASVLLEQAGLSGLIFKGVYNPNTINEKGYYSYYKDDTLYNYKNEEFKEINDSNYMISKFLNREKIDKLIYTNLLSNLRWTHFDFLNIKYIKIISTNHYEGELSIDPIFHYCEVETLFLQHLNREIKISGGASFLNAYKLKKLIIDFGVFSDANPNFLIGTPIAEGNGYIYVPDNLVDTVKTLDGWSTYASQIKPMTEFADKESYNYTIENDKVKITSYKDNLAYVGIPSTIDGYPVTNIGEDVFMENKNIVSVKLPITLETISNRAFFLCSNINTIEIPSSVTTIGSYGLWLSAIFEGEKTIIFKSSIPPTIQANSLPEVREGTLIIKVPVGYGDVYKTWDTNWEALANYIVEGE